MAVLRLVSPDDLVEQEAAADAERVRAEDQLRQDNVVTNSLVSFVDNQFSIFARHRDGASGWSDRMVNAMRIFKGEYDSQKLAEIRRFGGSDIYARVVATKCRGATSLLRDVYVNVDKPWGLEATPDPVLPDDIMADVNNLIQVEVATMVRLGERPTPDQIRDRVNGLLASAKRASISAAATS